MPRLAEAGWRTGAFLGAHVLDRETGLSDGFQHYDDRWGLGQRLIWIPALRALDLKRRPVARRGDETVDRALAWLAESAAPALLWVHLYDAHAPYRPPPGWGPDAQALIAARREDKARFREARGPGGLIDLLDHGREARDTLMYEASIRWVDALVGRLVAGLDPDTVLIVVGDHGESLTEHDYFFNHGARLWEEGVRVPFLVRWPGQLEAGSREEGLVSVMDVAPLVLAAAGLEGGELPGPQRSVEITSTGQQARQIGDFLRRVDRGSRKEGKRTQRQSAAVRLDGGKLLSHQGGEVEYYDLKVDPGEMDPQPVPEGLEGEALRVSELLELAPPELDEGQIVRLRALGYAD